MPEATGPRTLSPESKLKSWQLSLEYRLGGATRYRFGKHTNALESGSQNEIKIYIRWLKHLKILTRLRKVENCAISAARSLMPSVPLLRTM
jgi:hypothetical protein